MWSTPTIQSEVARVLRAFGVVRGHTVLAAYSTGPDSTALLAALCRVRGRLGIEVIAAYFDHGLRRRRAIEGDINHARLVTREFQVSLRVGAADSSDPVESGGPEAAARVARYRFLESVAGECGADWIAVGHTADDRAETVLMRALQGTGVAGLGGMMARRDHIIRPLLAVRRADLRVWLRSERLRFRRDVQNADKRFTRNRVRRVLVAVERRFPGAAERLAELGRQAESTQRFVADRAASELPWRRTSLGLMVVWQAFRDAASTLQVEALYQGYDLLFRGSGHRRLPRRFLSPLLRSTACGSERVYLAGHGIVVERAGADLVMSRVVVPEYRTGYLWEAVRSGSYKIPETDIEIRRVGSVRGERHRTVASVVHFDSVNGPLLVRSRRPGDEIRLRSGVKPLGALLREWGVPESKRWMIPVVADGRGVLAVCGAAFGCRDALSTWCADGKDIGAGAVIEICRVEEEL